MTIPGFSAEATLDSKSDVNFSARYCHYPLNMHDIVLPQKETKNGGTPVSECNPELSTCCNKTVKTCRCESAQACTDFKENCKQNKYGSSDCNERQCTCWKSLTRPPPGTGGPGPGPIIGR